MNDLFSKNQEPADEEFSEVQDTNQIDIFSDTASNQASDVNETQYAGESPTDCAGPETSSDSQESNNPEQDFEDSKRDTEHSEDSSDENKYATSLEESKQELIDVFYKYVYQESDAKTIVIFGKRGTGKTFDTDFLSRCFHSAGWRVHSILTVSSKISGCQHVNDVSGAYYHSLVDVRRLGKKSCIVIDEVDTFAPSQGKVDEHINQIINYGRHIKIWAVWNARRPAKVSTDLHSLADIVICHYLSSEKDIRYIEDIADEEFAEKVRIMKYKIEKGEISKYSREIFIG